MAVRIEAQPKVSTINLDPTIQAVRSSIGMRVFSPVKEGIIRGIERTKPAEKLVATAYHEIMHAIALGFDNVSKLSVIKEGNSLGRTIFNPNNISHAKSRIAAAAGALKPGENREAHGFGSDLSTVAILSALEGKDVKSSISASIREAAAVVGRYPTRLLEKMAEMVASRGEVNGQELKIIETQAMIELSLNDSENNAVQAAHDAFSEFNISDIPVRIDYIDDIILVTASKDGVEKTTQLCPFCLGADGAHDENCKLMTNASPFERVVEMVRNVITPTYATYETIGGRSSGNSEIESGKQPRMKEEFLDPFGLVTGIARRGNDGRTPNAA